MGSTPETWVEDAVDALALGGRVRRVIGPERSDVLRGIAAALLERPGVRFWWEHLRVPHESWQTASGYRHLPRLAPAPDTPCWLVAGLTEPDDAKGIFRCTPEFAASVIGESPGFEYALVDEALRWAVIENHHDVLLATGEAAGRLARLRDNQPLQRTGDAVE